WYYQSWFLLMLVGGLAALGAWGLIEPSFDDAIYLQGDVEQHDPLDLITFENQGGKRGKSDPEPLGESAGSITLRGHKIYLVRHTRLFVDGKAKGVVKPVDVSVGKTVGVYLDKSSLQNREEIAIALY